jgi:hypothetical protein
MNIDVSIKNARNLSVLSGIDKSIVEIILDISHIAVYEFDTSEGRWERYEVEGACFVVRRETQLGVPSFVVIVLNKQGIENFILDLVDCKKVKMQDPFIMMKTTMKGIPIIFGLWVHNDQERQQMFRTLDEKQKVVTEAIKSKSSFDDAFTSDSLFSKQTVSASAEFLTDRQISSEKKLYAKDAVPSPASKLKSFLHMQQQDAAQSSTLHVLLSPSDFTGIVKTFYL